VGVGVCAAPPPQAHPPEPPTLLWRSNAAALPFCRLGFVAVCVCVCVCVFAPPREEEVILRLVPASLCVFVCLCWEKGGGGGKAKSNENMCRSL
jgi:hypothetical protein